MKILPNFYIVQCLILIISLYFITFLIHIVAIYFNLNYHALVIIIMTDFLINLSNRPDILTEM